MTVTAAMPDAGSAKLYDMVTAVPEQTLTVLGNEDYEEVVPATAVVIAGGDRPLPADRFSGNPTEPDWVDHGHTAASKAHRQARFPVKLLQAAFGIKVEDGQASVETDRRHILNYLTGMPLDAEPPLTHAQYDRINKLLHAHYALGGLPRCFAEGGEALEQCLAALRASPPTDRFVVSAPFDDATVEQLIDLLSPTLQHLEMPRASMTVVPEAVGKFTALRTLTLSGCEKLTALPESVGNLGALQTLDLKGCYNLTALPESVGNLGALRTLDLNKCYSLTALPESVGNLGALHTLNLSACSKLTALPESVGNLGALRTLDLTNCEELTGLPESVGNLGALQTLDLKGCYNLTALPESVGNLGALRTLDLTYCEELTALPESVGNLGALRTLDLTNCSKLAALPESVGNLGALHTLDLSSCFNLKTLPASISQLSQLDEASREQVAALLRGALTALQNVSAGRYPRRASSDVAVHKCSRSSYAQRPAGLWYLRLHVLQRLVSLAARTSWTMVLRRSGVPARRARAPRS
jgi:Leucine-rich repeat (LRR) protein